RLVTVRRQPGSGYAVRQVDGKKYRSAVLMRGGALHILEADTDAFASDDDMQAQASHFDHRRITRRIGLKRERGYWLACGGRIVCGGKCRSYSFARQGERSGMGRPFGKYDCIFSISSKAVLARLEPEQSSQRQPFLFKIFDMFAFPFIEGLLVSGVGRKRGLISC